MLWDRDMYIDHMTFHPVGRELSCELFGPLLGLDREWREQGATEDEVSLRAFGWDGVKHIGVGVNVGAVTGISPKMLTDNEKEQIFIDGMGRTMRLIKSSATIALPQSHVVKTEDDWARIRHWYEFDESRVNYEHLRKLKKLREEGYLIIAGIPGGFDEPRQLMGEENLCYAFYDMPEMITDMLETFSSTARKLFEIVSDYVQIDHLVVHEDMAGKSGPLMGPDLVRKFIVPYYRSVWDPLHDAGAKLFSMDSDGNVEPDIEAFLEGGLNIISPCEPQAGMDIVRLRKQYGTRMAFKGGINKFALRGTKEDVRKELEYKVCTETRGGGTVFALDHRIPNGVPIENYRYYAKMLREMLGQEILPADFMRMAF